MAFTAGKSKEIEGKSNDWLLDQSLMQSMQDRFCDANNVYMVCLNAQNGVVTKRNRNMCTAKRAGSVMFRFWKK